MSAADYLVLAEATVVLTLARAGLWLLPFGVLQRVVDRTRPRRRASSAGEIDRVAWAVKAISRRFSRGMTCLVEALAVGAMLRRRGYAPALRFGVRERADDSHAIEAHAWIECEGTIVVGQREDLSDYAVLSAPARS